MHFAVARYFGRCASVLKGNKGERCVYEIGEHRGLTWLYIYLGEGRCRLVVLGNQRFGFLCLSKDPV